MKDFWKNMPKPIIALAPMDGYSDSAYRQVVKKVAPNVMCFSEFYSADGLVYSKFLADSVLPHAESEKPLIIQIFGKEPEMFAKAAQIIERYNIAGIDINMWCPAKKVVKSWHGSGLIINQDTAFRIIETINKATKLPISVKTRLSFDWGQGLLDFAKGLESAWASLLSVHGRTAKQAYTWVADFTQIYEVKKHLSIPVICNWDIKNYDDWMNKLTPPPSLPLTKGEGQHLDWFMIGRGSFGNPWAFLPGNYKPTLWEILDIMEFHADKLMLTKWERRGSLEVRKHLVLYLREFPWVKHYRKSIVTVNNLEEVQAVISQIKSDYLTQLHLKPSEIE